MTQWALYGYVVLDVILVSLAIYEEKWLLAYLFFAYLNANVGYILLDRYYFS